MSTYVYRTDGPYPDDYGFLKVTSYDDPGGGSEVNSKSARKLNQQPIPELWSEV